MVPIFTWKVPLVSIIFLKQSLVFPILLFSFISFHWSLRKAFFSFLAVLWNSAFKFFHFTVNYTLFTEKAVAAHSSTLAWKIPCMEEPGGLQSMGSLRVGHDWATSQLPFHFSALEKEMATHSSILAWKISCTEEAGGLQSMGSQRVGHDWVTNTQE